MCFHNSPYSDPFEKDAKIFDEEFERAPENFEPEVQEAMAVLAEGGTPERIEWAMDVYYKAVNDYKINKYDYDIEDYERELYDKYY